MEDKQQLYEQYEYVAHQTLFRIFHNPYKLAESHHMEFNDLLQRAKMAVWEACLNYDNTKNAEFETYAINMVKWKIMRLINRYGSVVTHKKHQKQHFQEEDAKLINLDQKVANDEENTMTYHEVIASDINTDKDAIWNTQLNKICKGLDKRQRKIIEMILEDKPYEEIGKQLNISKQRVGQLFLKMKDTVINNYEMEMVQ